MPLPLNHVSVSHYLVYTAVCHDLSANSPGRGGGEGGINGGDAGEAVCLNSASRAAEHIARQSDLKASKQFRVQIQKNL